MPTVACEKLNSAMYADGIPKGRADPLAAWEGCGEPIGKVPHVLCTAFFERKRLPARHEREATMKNV